MENLEFKFEMLSKRQLLKLASAYSVKIQGSMPNNHTSEEELLSAVKKQLKILDDGSILRHDEKDSLNYDREVKLTGGAKVRMIII
jgi:hypothetical protein